MQVPHLGLLTDLSRVASGESRRSTVEHPFATLKYHIFGHRRLFYVLVDKRKRRSAWSSILLDANCTMNVLGQTQVAATQAPA